MSVDRTTVAEVIAKLQQFPPDTLVVSHMADPHPWDGQIDGVNVFETRGYESRDGWVLENRYDSEPDKLVRISCWCYNHPDLLEEMEVDDGNAS